jgi:hypothetical protein
MGKITTSEELQIGRIYYVVHYEDQFSESPLITTLQYDRLVGANSGRMLHMFKKCIFDIENEEMFIPPDMLDGLLFDAEGLIEILKG